MKKIFTCSTDKKVWDTNDFERMGWHDCHIHALAFKEESSEFLLDLDYIVQWIDPDKEEKYFKFFISPATLVFNGVSNLRFINFAMDMEIEIQKISMDKNSGEYTFSIECQQGTMVFQASGFKQYLRKEPIFINPNSQQLDSQKLSLETRGGISFK